jgi:hypothetical protein
MTPIAMTPPPVGTARRYPMATSRRNACSTSSTTEGTVWTTRPDPLGPSPAVQASQSTSVRDRKPCGSAGFPSSGGPICPSERDPDRPGIQAGVLTAPSLLASAVDLPGRHLARPQRLRLARGGVAAGGRAGTGPRRRRVLVATVAAAGRPPSSPRATTPSSSIPPRWRGPPSSGHASTTSTVNRQLRLDSRSDTRPTPLATP